MTTTKQAPVITPPSADWRKLCSVVGVEELRKAYDSRNRHKGDTLLCTYPQAGGVRLIGASFVLFLSIDTSGMFGDVYRLQGERNAKRIEKGTLPPVLLGSGVYSSDEIRAAVWRMAGCDAKTT